LRRRYRLRDRADFRAALGAGRVYSGPTLVAFARPRPDLSGASRVGVTVSRQVRGAVHRNRARRRVREAARLRLLRDDSGLLRSGIPYDVVLIARPSALEAAFSAVLQDAERVDRRLTAAQRMKP